MTTRQWIEQMLRDGIPEFTEVAGAANLEAIYQGHARAPGCYVYRVGWKPVGTDLSSQTIETAYGIVIAVDNKRDKLWGDSSDRVETLCKQVTSELNGVTPDGETFPLLRDGGGIVRLDANKQKLYWQELYTVQSYDDLPD
jgi:hypothetical protein